MPGPGAVPRSYDHAGGLLLAVRWSDGSETVFDQKALRLACPCAVCRGRREKLGERFLPPSALETIRIERAAPVGRYGVKFSWSDGHDAGIYTFEMLREWAAGAGGTPIA